MKKAILFLLPVFIIASAFVNKATLEEKISVDETKIEWLTLEEAVAKNATNPKMIFIDFYTDWNEWSTKMNNDIFPNPQIIEAMTKNFYAVKINVEQDQTIKFKGKDYVLDKSGREPMHQIAQELATNNDRLGVPTHVILDKNLTRLKAFQGYLSVDRLKQILDYYGIEENYKNKTWIEFVQESGF